MLKWGHDYHKLLGGISLWRALDGGRFYLVWPLVWQGVVKGG